MRPVGLQPDIYQRYAVLSALAAAMRAAGGGTELGVLDVGCGPQRLTEAFLGPGFRVTRADTETFGDPAIVRLSPGDPLPFEPASFALVVAVDVLEHVPAELRDHFIGECRRVAAGACILCFPQGLAPVRTAEAALQRVARGLSSGKGLAFLDEHAALELPVPEAVVAAFERQWPHVAQIASAPLTDWLIYNTLDLVYAARFGDGTEKADANEQVNGRLPLTGPPADCYRLFVAGTASALLRDRFAAVGRELASCPRPSPLEESATVAEAIARITDALGRRAAADVSREHDANQRHIEKLDLVVREWQDAVAAKDRHIEGLQLEVQRLTRALDQTQRQTRDAAGPHAVGVRRRARVTWRSIGLPGGSLRRQARLVAASGLFDPGFCREAAPNGTSVLADFLRRRGADAPAPHPLFDPVHYVARNPESSGTNPLVHWLEAVPGAAASPHPLFDVQFYLATNEDVRRSGVNPLVHYVRHGGREGRQPHPLFDVAYYLACNPDVRLQGVEPLSHYVVHGAREGRQPHPLFDPAFYLARNPDVGGAGVNPLVHFVLHGGHEGRQPHPLFDAGYYLQSNPDVREAGINPLVHYLQYGARERRSPHPLIDLAEYLQRNPDLAEAGVDPLVHYVLHGAAEGRRLTLLFDPQHYRTTYADVVQSGADPLLHYLSSGEREGRWPNRYFDPAFYRARNPQLAAAGLSPLAHYVLAGAAEEQPASASFDTARYLREHPEVAASKTNPLLHYILSGGGPQSEREQPSAAFVPPCGLLPWFNPLNTAVDEALRHAPAVNVLLPSLSTRHLSGGPNTALHIAYRLAVAGVRTRLVATDAPLDADLSGLWKHVLHLVAATERPPALEIADAHDRSRPFVFGPNDLFFATAWWTAQMAKYASRRTRYARFLYLIQDYEPLLHAASTPQALAEETYGLDFVPVVNASSLADYLTCHEIGRFVDPAVRTRALVFEPAVDRTRFYPEPPEPGRPRRLLFYARPSQGLRNLFELGVAALMKAAADGVFDGERWELLGMGEAFAPVDLGRGLTLAPTPWLDFDGYAAQMRQSDVLVSLMLSPHPSYPPLEMAACGGRVVTTTFATKTAARLAEISPLILGAEPTIEGIAAALARAVLDVREQGRAAASELSLPGTWDESLRPVMEGLTEALFDWWAVPEPARSLEPCPWPRNRHEVVRLEAMVTRDALGLPAPESGLLSFVTPVWNTDASMLRELAASVLADAAEGRYEWVILDNGSTAAETLRVLEELRRHPAVRIERSAENLGIVAGLRRLLDLARHRYVAFVDHDDLVSHDCARVLSAAIRAAGYPALLYTDEDKRGRGPHEAGYFKPGWDPVLFANSCYTAHLSVVDRGRAVALGACTDPAVEGSHDWDTFTRFVLAGHVPVHVPDILYTWRVHDHSTAAQLEAKPYVIDSQRAVLRRFLDGRPAGHRFEVVQSPLFERPGDWWLRRCPVDPPRYTTAVLAGVAGEPVSHLSLPGPFDHEVVAIDAHEPLPHLAQLAADGERRGRLLHVLWSGLEIDGDAWAWEAAGVLELFPDTVMVGGRGHRGGRVLFAGEYFRQDGRCDSPDTGRPTGDPGYFSQHLKPHSVSAVAPWHAVVRPAFLADALRTLDTIPLHLGTLGGWLGAHARRRSARVVYTPFLEARVPPGMVLPSDPAAAAFFASVNADLVTDREGPSPAIAAARAGVDPPPVRRSVREADPDRPEYAAWLAARQRIRSIGAGARRGPSLSVLTTVYHGTDGRLFRETADSVLPQLSQRDEWVVLAHGPVTDETEDLLRFLGQLARARVLRRPENLGIAGGMRVCLTAASGEYVLPVDADDLLTPDALRLVREAVGSTRRPVLVYTDEDFLVDGRPAHPYARPDFDPALALESSWVWHLCAFERAAALAAGVYGDDGATYCHDWDTLQRLAATGRPIDHVREVAYHWRTHAGSHTNTSEVHPGSLASVRHVLERARLGLPRPERFAVESFPIFRGMDEPYLARRHEAEPRADWYVMSETFAPGTPPGSGFPFRAIDELLAGPRFAETLRGRVASTSAEMVALSDARLTLSDGWMWEAVRLLELHPDAAVASGRVISGTGVVRASCGVLDAEGRRWEEGLATTRADAGPFALYLKPHHVHFACDSLLVADTAWLREQMDAMPPWVNATSLAIWLSLAAWRSRRPIIYSPLVEGIGEPPPAGEDRLVALRVAEEGMRRAAAPRPVGTSRLTTLHALTR